MYLDKSDRAVPTIGISGIKAGKVAPEASVDPLLLVLRYLLLPGIRVIGPSYGLHLKPNVLVFDWSVELP